MQNHMSSRMLGIDAAMAHRACKQRGKEMRCGRAIEIVDRLINAAPDMGFKVFAQSLGDGREQLEGNM